MESLEDTISKCKLMLSTFPKETKQWDKRMFALNENWDSCRSEIFEVLVSEEASLGNEFCCLCLKQDCKIRCYSCFGKRFCGACDLIAHEHNQFHDRDVFVSGFFQAVPPTTSINDDGDLISISMSHKFFSSTCYIDSSACSCYLDLTLLSGKTPSFLRPPCCPFCTEVSLEESFGSNNTLIIVNSKGKYSY